MLCAPLPAAAQDRPAPPQRIVSLNLCADEMLLRLVPRERMASVTFLGADPVSSTVADKAAGLRLNRGLAEEVIPLQPDLVVTGAFTTRATADMLRRFGIDVLELPLPQTPEDAIAQLRMLAARVGAPERGEAMAQQMEEAFRQRPLPAHPRTAVVVRPNGFTAGRNSLPDTMMRRAGLDNLAARLAPDRLGQVSLEEIVVARPDVLVVEVPEEEPPSVAQSLLDHPALARTAARGQVVEVPTRLWACPGPQMAEAMARLAAAAQAGPADPEHGR